MKYILTWWFCTMLLIGLRQGPTVQATTTTPGYKSGETYDSGLTASLDKNQKYVLLYCNLSKKDLSLHKISTKFYTYTWVVKADCAIQGVLNFMINHLFNENKDLLSINFVGRQSDGTFQQIFSEGAFSPGSVTPAVLDKGQLLDKLRDNIGQDSSFKQYAQLQSFDDAFLLSAEDIEQYFAAGFSYFSQKDTFKDVDKRVVSAAVWDLLMDDIQEKSAIYQKKRGEFQLGSLQKIGLKSPNIQASMEHVTKNFMYTTVDNEPTSQGFSSVSSGLTGVGVGAAVTYVTLSIAYPSLKKEKVKKVQY